MMDLNKLPFGDMFRLNFQKMYSGSNATIDLKTLMDAMRKNAQALTEAQRLALESYQAITQRQSELLSQMVEDQSLLSKDMLTEGTPEQKVARQAELTKRIYERSVGGVKEIADMLTKSQSEAVTILNKRVSATLNDIKNVMDRAGEERSSKTGKKAA